MNPPHKTTSAIIKHFKCCCNFSGSISPFSENHKLNFAIYLCLPAWFPVSNKNFSRKGAGASHNILKAILKWSNTYKRWLGPAYCHTFYRCKISIKTISLKPATNNRKFQTKNVYKVFFIFYTFFHYCPHCWKYQTPTLFLCPHFLQIIKPSRLAFLFR